MKQESNGRGSLARQIALLVGQILIAAGKPLVVYAACDLVTAHADGQGITIADLLKTLDSMIEDAEREAAYPVQKGSPSFADGYNAGMANALRSVRSLIRA